MKKKYRPKIGFIKFTPLFLALGYLGIDYFLRGKALGNWALYGSLIMMVLTPTIFSIPIRYIIDNSTLIIKYALFAKMKIDIDKIVKIKETNSIFSINALALSLDRIEITYIKYNKYDKCNEYDTVTISPKHKHEFIQDLMRVNLGIDVVYAISGDTAATN